MLVFASIYCMVFGIDLTDVRLLFVGTGVFVGIVIIWAVLSSFVSVVSGLVINADKQKYNELMQSFKERFEDIFNNDSYTEVKQQYLFKELAAELKQINHKFTKKYIGTVVKDTATVYNIETYPGEVPNNVYLKLPAGNDEFIWCVFNDVKSRYINFDKGEEVEVDGVVNKLNLVPAKLPPSLKYNIESFFHADFAVHLQDDAKIKKSKVK